MSVIAYEEYKKVFDELQGANENLKSKVEIIAALETIIATMGTEEMKAEMVKKLAEILREG